MTTRRNKTLESLSGIGTVYHDKEFIAKVRYHIIESQEVLVAQTFGGTSQLDGLKSANGSLSLMEGESHLMKYDDPLVLELEDGRRMSFFATNYSSMTGNYTIVRTGGWLDTEGREIGQ